MSAARNDLGRRLVGAIGAENVVSTEYRDDIVVLLCEFGGERHHVRIIDVVGLENDRFVSEATNSQQEPKT